MGDREETVKSEVVLVPTYQRPEMLFYCLTLLRAFDHNIPIAIFPDRGTMHDPELQMIFEQFNDGNLFLHWVPDHDYYGNTFNTMEAFRWAYNTRAERIYYVEDDVMIHHDFFKWHREMHDDFGDDIFASMAWVFNHHAPISADPMFQPWYYSVGTCFSREKLELIVRHSTPRYYAHMPEYIEEVFKGSKLNHPINIAHYEQDGLIQRVLDQDRTQTVSCGMAHCTHLGTFGYNKGWEKRNDFFEGAKEFDERVARISKLIADPYWRASLFGRAIVEREIGKELPPRLRKYLLRVGAFECEYESELDVDQLPKRLRSVPRTPEMEIVVES